LNIYDNALDAIIIFIESEYEIMAGSDKRRTNFINREIKKLVETAWSEAELDN